MIIAVFSDVHGRILQCFKLCESWENENNEKIDLILQAGDLGIFPNLERLDKATKKYAMKDEEEIGFYHDFYQNPECAEGVLKKPGCNLVFVRGNHEDHDFLDFLEAKHIDAIFPVDPYNRIFCLKSGLVYTFSNGYEKIRILGIGRIGEIKKRKPPYNKYIQEFERQRILSLREDFDILLTHDSAKDFVTQGFGMEEINIVLENFKPIYHFHGHTGEDFNVKYFGSTTVVKVSDLTKKKRKGHRILNRRCMAILRWKDRENHSLEIANIW